MNNPKIPSRDECLDILNKNKTSSNVIEHCKTVCKVAEDVADKLIGKGISVNKGLVTAAALLHDVERVKDEHIIRGVKLIKSLGYPEVAEVLGKHSLYKQEESPPKTIEEKIVFYADKRVMRNNIVSLEERFEDLKKRYNLDFTKELEFTKKIEEELIN